MSDELKEEMKKMKEEIAGLRDQLKGLTEGERKPRGLYIDIQNPMHEYVDEVMQGVAQGVHGELDRSIFIGPRGVRIMRGPPPIRDDQGYKPDFTKTAEAMNALSHEHRLKILDELMAGGRYINELQEKLPDITTSTLSSHLNILVDAGLVVQEKVRGRYLITIPGRTAYKMATQVAKFLEQRDTP